MLLQTKKQARKPAFLIKFGVSFIVLHSQHPIYRVVHCWGRYILLTKYRCRWVHLYYF
jgi:hypothetical protein